MVSLILDTNIWIAFVAKEKPLGLLDQLKESKAKGDIILLSNEIIVEEWFRNKEQTINNVTKQIKGIFDSAKKLASFLHGNEKKNYLNKLESIFSQERKRIELAVKRVEETEKLIMDCEMTPITNEMKIKVANWALNKKAPFLKKANSVGDALILLSSVEYCKTKTTGIDDSIFVSFNHEDYTNRKNKDVIHRDLQDFIDNANMRFTNNIGKALNLTPKLIQEIDDYINYMLESWIEMQTEIARGK